MSETREVPCPELTPLIQPAVRPAGSRLPRPARRQASDPHDPRRDRDPREPIDPPARHDPEEDPEQGPPPVPPVEEPLDAPGAGEPAWRDPASREPPRVDP